MTKLALKSGNKNIPAWLLKGIEAFCIKHEDGTIEKHLIIDGKSMLFEESPGEVQRRFGQLFIDDKQGQKYLKQMGITTFREGFDQWFFCVLGGLDSNPDIVNGELSPDAFNNSCSDMECQFRGKFCGRKSNLRSYEVETLAALKRGLSISESAEALCISEPGMKSRVIILKEKLNAHNMAMLTARATELGI